MAILNSLFHVPPPSLFVFAVCTCVSVCLVSACVCPSGWLAGVLSVFCFLLFAQAAGKEMYLSSAQGPIMVRLLGEQDSSSAKVCNVWIVVLVEEWELSFICLWSDYEVTASCFPPPVAVEPLLPLCRCSAVIHVQFEVAPCPNSSQFR